jgi:hypothetical protein
VQAVLQPVSPLKSLADALSAPHQQKHLWCDSSGRFSSSSVFGA